MQTNAIVFGHEVYMKQDILPQSTRVLHVSITIRTGRAGHQRKPMRRFFFSLRHLKLTSAYRIGQHALILFISHSRGDRRPQCLCLEQSKIRQTSSGHGVVILVLSEISA